MNWTRISIYSILCITLLFGACKKDDDNGNFVADDLSVDGGWSILSIETDLDEQASTIVSKIPTADLGGVTPSIYEMFLVSTAQEQEDLQDCKKDDAYLFFRNGLVGFRNKNTICDTSAGEDSDAFIPDDASWSVVGEQLRISEGGAVQTNYNIITLAGNSLILEFREPFMDDALNISTDDEITVRYTLESNN